MTYTIDIYRGEISPIKNFSDFALFVVFFPVLLSGPIERAKRLLPQISALRKIDLEQFYEGSYLIFWGLVQKVVLADNFAKIVDPIFRSQPPYNGLQVLVALYAFSMQIFCDFSGYSDMARGIGKCMGFDIMINFNLPYFAANPREFWRRWHISLSSWLRDYLYIGLGGSRKGVFLTYVNIAIVMLLCGLWHGAAWTFIMWGAYHGILLIVHRLATVRQAIPEEASAKRGAGLWHMLKVIAFFHLVCFGWLFFRADSMAQVRDMAYALASSFYFKPDIGLIYDSVRLMFFGAFLLAVQVLQYRHNDLLAVFRSSFLFRTAFYVVCYFLLILTGSWNAQFIYFQF
jgi:D-alanyl-lipoteichoic acid acyltransferase DltB (MBOAT superfamily)